MGACYFFLVSLGLAAILSWLMPMIDNISSIYPNILLIEGIKQLNDPPLYSALIKTFQNFENKPKDINLSEKPLYDESTFAIPILSKNNSICILLIRTELTSENIADPYVTDIKMLERSIEDLFTPINGTWKELWSMKLPGKVYLISSSKNYFDLILVFQVNLPQGQSHKFRYFQDRTILKYTDFLLPGSSSILSLSVYRDHLVYSIEEGFYHYHYLIKQEIELENNETEIIWKEINHGLFHNRKDFGLSEVTGLKLFEENSSIYMLQIIVTANTWVSTGRLSLELLELNETEWTSMGILYNLTLNLNVLWTSI